MELYIIIALIAVVIILAFVIFKNQFHKFKHSDETQSAISNNTELSEMADDRLPEYQIKFESIPALSSNEESNLVEITDKKLLTQIDAAIPGTLQIITGAIGQHAINSAGQIYQAILPHGATLANSKAMEGAVRGFYHGSKGIAGHANFIPVDGIKGLAIANKLNLAMGVASVVVGQYYMNRINKRLASMDKKINKVLGLFKVEYQSKVYALVTDIQKCSQFQMEITDNNELRNRELIHLKEIEHKCAELLAEANLFLKECSEINTEDYEVYENTLFDIDIWYNCQKLLLLLMARIGDLTYVLNLGVISKDHAFDLLKQYTQQANNALDLLKEWHKQNIAKYEIDLQSLKRKRSGIGGAFMSIPGLFNDSLNYLDVPSEIGKIVNNHINASATIEPIDDDDLYQKDVKLIAKENKLYYLPAE